MAAGSRCGAALSGGSRPFRRLDAPEIASASKIADPTTDKSLFFENAGMGVPAAKQPAVGNFGDRVASTASEASRTQPRPLAPGPRPLFFALLLLSGCGKYADFSLPRLPGGDPALTFALDTQPEPVLPRGSESDVLNPSVVRTPSGLLNFYSAFDGQSWRTMMALSNDGVHWATGHTIQRPDPRTWEASYMAANGSVLVQDGQLWHWFEAGPKGALKIGLARSTDASMWRKESAPVLDTGPYMSWDERDVADPYAIRIGPYFYMYYLGQDRAEPPRQRIGVALSRDGVQWTKLRTNPILELGDPGAFDEAGLGEPAVWNSHGFYWMLYTGRDSGERRRMGLARSTDGVHWQKLPTVFAGTQAWDAQVLCDATVLIEGSEIRVWFGGGYAASPDENLHGQIGYGILRPVHATLAK